MSNYEEIKQALANSDIRQGILIALSNSLQIKIASSIKEKENQTQQIVTNLNLIQGINTQIDAKVLQEKQYQNLIDFHRQQLNSVDELWQKNRETLVKIYQLLLGNLELEENEITNSEISTEIESRQNEQQANTSRQSDLASDEFENFDLELVTEEKTNQEEIPSTESEKSVSTIVSEAQEENWLDEINEIDEEIDNTSENNVTPTNTTNNLESELEWDNLPSEESLITTEAETEERIDEEVEITAEIAEENWDEIDWDQEMGENEASEIQEENFENTNDISVDNESSPSLEIDDDWKEWIDEEDLSPSPSNNNQQELKDIDWSQEDWQNVNG